MVAAAHPLAAKAGRDVLKAGGNAVDAAIAASLTLAVVAPAFSGLGGGGFMLIHQTKTGKSVALDYRETAPEAARADMYQIDKDGNVENDANSIGHLAIAVPGQVRGYAIALERWGTMPIKSLAKSAVRYASHGYPLSKTIGKIFRENRDHARDKIQRFPALGRVFGRGAVPRTGQRIRMADLASSLGKFAVEGSDLFYSGPVARMIVTHVAEGGGILTLEDLAGYEARIREPVVGDYRGFEIVSMPPPSSGGITLIEVLNILETFRLSSFKHNAKDFIHIVAEAVKLGYADRGRYIGDPDFVNVPTERLVTKGFAEARRKLISPYRVNLDVLPGVIDPYEGGSTTHFTVADKDGNVVAATESIECCFGSGVMVPGAGIIMNDQMHDFDPVPGSINSIQARKRPLSSMAPTIVLKDSRPLLCLGSAAGPRIITAILQVLLNVLDFGMPVHEAVAAPRFHCQGSALSLEGGVPAKTQAGLVELGHVIERKRKLDLFFGGVQAIHIHKREMTGMADPRRDGTAMGI